jgi:hypothetical protein
MLKELSKANVEDSPTRLLMLEAYAQGFENGDLGVGADLK